MTEHDKLAEALATWAAEKEAHRLAMRGDSFRAINDARKAMEEARARVHPDDIIAALAAARAQGAAEAFERAMAECDSVLAAAGRANDAYAYSAAKIIHAAIRALAAGEARK